MTIYFLGPDLRGFYSSNVPYRANLVAAQLVNAQLRHDKCSWYGMTLYHYGLAIKLDDIGQLNYFLLDIVHESYLSPEAKSPIPSKWQTV